MRFPNDVIAVALAALLTACKLPIAGRPTAVPTPHPTVIVITVTGPFFETFDSPGDWLIGQSEISEGRVEDGRYLLAVHRPATIAWASQPRAFGDGVYELDATQISGAEASGFGLLFLAPSDMTSFIYALITGDGRYDVGYCQQSCEVQESLIGGYTLAQIIRTENQWNHLRVELFAGTLTLVVNGAAVTEVTGLTYAGPGLVGLIGESSQYGGFEAAFDNLSVLESNPAPSPAPTGTMPPP